MNVKHLIELQQQYLNQASHSILVLGPKYSGKTSLITTCSSPPHPKQQTLQHIIVMLDALWLIAANGDYLANVSQQIADTLQTYSKLSYKPNLYFFINKCDQIPGFLDTFKDYTAEEKAQALGLQQLQATNEQTFRENVQRAVEQLCQSLPQSLHQVCQLAGEFSDQVVQHQTGLATQVTGVYFMAVKPQAASTSYFSHNIFQKILQDKISTKSKYQPYALILLVIILCLLLSSGLSIWFKHKTPQKTQQTKIYHKLPQALTDLKQTVLHDLTTGLVRDPSKRYSSLRAYLMLSGKLTVNPYYLASYLNHYHQQTKYHLSQLVANFSKLATRKASLHYNSSLVSNARSSLHKLSPAQLGLVMLTDKYLIKPSLQLIPRALQTAFNQQVPNIPYIYTQAGLSQINRRELQQISQAVLHGNTVIGQQNYTVFNPLSTEQLSEKVRALYLQSYQILWFDFLHALHLKPLKNTHDIANVYQLLAKQPQAFYQILTAISVNMQPLLQNNSLTLSSTKNLPALKLELNILNAFLTGLNQQQLHAEQQAYNILAHAFQQITKSKTPLKSAWQISLQRLDKQSNIAQAFSHLQQLISSSPPSLQTWLNTLYNDSWTFLLQQSARYIQHQWQTSVYSFYQQHLQNTYPLNQHSVPQASLENFKHFFSPQGLLPQFIDTYLSPFIDQTQQPWALKPVFGKQLTIPYKSLLELQLVSFIQSVYFPAPNHTLASYLKVQIKTMDPTVSAVFMTIGQQRLNLTRNHAQTIHWPADTHHAITQLNLVSASRTNNAVMLKGPFSLWQLFDHANISPTKNPLQFIAEFTINHQHLSLLITTQQNLSPLNAEVFQQFYLPERLIK